MGGCRGCPRTGLHPAGRDQRHTHAPLGDLPPGVLLEPGHRPLGRPVDVAGRGHETCDAADQHDPAPGLLEGVDGGPDEQRGTEHIRQHHLGPPGRIALGNRVMGGGPGVGDNRVEPAELLQGGVDGRADLVVLGRAAGDGQQTAGTAEFVGEVAQPPFTAPGDGHPLPHVEELTCHGGAYAAATARDQRDRRIGQGYPLGLVERRKVHHLERSPSQASQQPSGSGAATGHVRQGGRRCRPCEP